MAAQETIQREEAARTDGEAWADDGEIPTALMAENPYAYLLEVADQTGDVKNRMPKTYAEAMRRPDLWVPAMQEKLKMMEDRGVFELVLESQVLRNKNIVRCRWVYVNKFDAEGVVT